MNRYALGGAIGLLMLLALSGMGGLDRLFQGNGAGRGDLSAADDTLGTLPIEQAGQVVQRQSSPTPGIPATGTNIPGTPTSVSGDFPPTNGGFTAPAGTPPTLNPTQPGIPQNVIPQSGGATTLPAQVGDIAPVQPGLVQPDPVPPVTDDPELESIPALW
ncbi:MAG: hypothetical protein ACHWZW_07995 [Spirulina sp.]